ncbi:protein 4.1-like isoform X2 [Megalops cyprinoides]|uniref:protein 4.1-like isoform X2 n=1 Tax=Megalops cyprinoides TaxID=118141 RepID=UPI001864D798|nr:protein 4.1-like isoform X2 [Megalops cyprinoides]
MTTDEAQQQKEQAQDPGPSSPQEAPAGHSPSSPPEEQPLKPRSRTSAGRGLSRLFSSFLKRSSQCSEGEGFETERADREKGEELKAPIADPEPELRIEGDPAFDQHSLSSCEIQLGPDHKTKEEEGEKGEEKDQREEEEGVEEEEGDDSVEEKDEEEEEEEEEGEDKLEDKEEEEKDIKDPTSPTPPRRPGVMNCKVTLLDNTLYECELDKHAKGQELFVRVCDHLNLLERDYYGLAIWETPSVKTWVDLTKEIRRQVQGTSCDCTFNVKFYPPDPAHLTEDITRYFLVLQLRKDILSGRLPCSFVTLALLGSYALLSELGEYDPDLHGNGYAKELRLAPGQTRELEEKMMELHRTYKSMSPAQADMMFLENAKKLAMYGVDLHPAKDLDGVDIMLGVCSGGLMVFKERLRINRFPWPKVLKISYKRSSFFIKIRPSELELYESTIGFKLPNYRASKKLWKVCVEHHTFFRLTSTEVATTPRRFLALGSKFRYSGRTQAQTRQASSMIDRPAPLFQRSASKRESRSLDGAAMTPDKSTRPISAPLIPPGPSGGGAPPPAATATPRASRQNAATPTGRTPRQEKKAEMKTERQVERSSKPEPALEVKTVARRERREKPTVTAANGERKSQKRPKKTEADTIYIRHSNLMLEDLDRTQEGIMRHHTSISELKRSFMESVPEPRPSEWDKRLSTSSPFRTASINGQLQPGSPLVKTHTVTISDVTNAVRGDVSAMEVPIVHTETKTITYEAAQPLDSGDSGVLLSAQTITSETVSTTTTTQITKTVRGGISETRIEKRIVITGDAEIDHDQALAQAIKEAKEQHPDMSVTRVVVHQETEITPQ